MNTFYNFTIPTIETKRLLIRPLTLDDAEAMFQNWASDSRVTKYLTWDAHSDVDATKIIIKKWINDYLESSTINWGIEYKENHTLIGTIGLVKVDKAFKECEIGYCMAYDYWNQGIMSEAVKELLKTLFTTFGFLKVYACHDARNLASGKVMKKAGMKFISSSNRIISKNIQLINYALTKDEWLEEMGTSRVFVIMDNNKERLELDTLISYRTYQNSIVITLKSNLEEALERDIQKIQEYYKNDIIGYDTLSLEKMIISELFRREWTISCAESCTGGMIISKLINVEGTSNVIKESYVTYSAESKMRILGVKKTTIRKYGVASTVVAEEMADGLMKISNADVCIAVTGYAGSSGDKNDDGTFFFAIKIHDYVYIEEHQVFGPRNDCRASQTRYILWRLKMLLDTF